MEVTNSVCVPNHGGPRSFDSTDFSLIRPLQRPCPSWCFALFEFFEGAALSMVVTDTRN